MKKGIFGKKEEPNGEVKEQIIEQIICLRREYDTKPHQVANGLVQKLDSLRTDYKQDYKHEQFKYDFYEEKGKTILIPKKGKASFIAEINGKDESFEVEVSFSELFHKTVTIELYGSKQFTPYMIEFLKDLEIKEDEQAKIKTFDGRPIKLEGYSWIDVGGLNTVKQTLEEYISWPLKNPKLLKNRGLKPPSGVVLYGPPGTGKTLIAKVLACESNINFISVSGADITSKWYGDSEKRIRALFNFAREEVPAIIYFDDFDGLFRKRDKDTYEATQRIVAQILTEIDGLEGLEGVIVVASTNRLDAVDSALLRPGRLGKKIKIPLPDEKGRLEILRIHTKSMSLAEDVSLEKIAKDTENYSGADLENLCYTAGFRSINRYLATTSKTIEDIPKEEYEKITVINDDLQYVLADEGE